jgi:hypothetical protein
MTSKWHFWIGMFGLLTFLSASLYLDVRLPELHADNDGIRYQYRANLAYILLASLANILTGLNLAWSGPQWRWQLQRLGSLLLMLTPAIFVLAFALEPPLATDEHPLTTSGMLFMVSGTGLQMLARLVGRNVPRLAKRHGSGYA